MFYETWWIFLLSAVFLLFFCDFLWFVFVFVCCVIVSFVLFFFFDGRLPSILLKPEINF